MKLREMLEIPAFGGFRVAAGHGGLDREVSTVSVMDAPDIYEWMKGGEFLITSGYVLKDDPASFAELIGKLDTWGAAAFGIKLGRFIAEIPQAVIETAERLNFPIIVIPIEFAFTEVINPVLQEVVNRKTREMMYTETVHREFTRLALEDRPIEAILKTLEQYIFCDTVYFDTVFNRALFAREDPGNELHAAALSVERREKPLSSLMARYPHYRLDTRDGEYGILFFGRRQEGFDGSFENYYRITVEQSGVILIIKAQKLLARKRVEEGYRELFVDDLMRAGIDAREELSNRARIYGWDFRDGGFAAILDVSGIREQYRSGLDRARDKSLADMMEKIAWTSADIIRQVFPQAVYSRASDQIRFAVSSEACDKETLKKRITRTFEAVRQTVQHQTGRILTVGVGSWKADFYAVSESCREAERALCIADEQGDRDRIIFYDDLGVMKLLAQVCRSEEAGELYREYIKKLKEYDAGHEGSLVRTMQVLVNCEWNLKKASEALFIHYNSMKYRFRRVCQILDCEFDSADEKLNMAIALKLFAIMNADSIDSL